jgi:hypothetical protein
MTNRRDVEVERVREDNAASIAAANKKYAAAVVIDPGKLVNKDGTQINLFSTKAIKNWLKEKYLGSWVIIADDGQIVEFTTRGFGDDQKRKADVLAQRKAYAGLDSVVVNSIYYSYELGDAKHSHVDRQKTYYGLISLSGHYYAARVRIDIHRCKKDVGYFKDFDVAKIKTPSQHHRGRLESGRTYLKEGDDTVPIPEIVRAFERTTSINIQVLESKVNTQRKENPETC